MSTLPNKLAFVDLETTGGRFGYDRIIEIGIVRVEDNIVTSVFNSLVNPDRSIPPFVENLTGINRESLEQAPTLYEIKDEILETLSDCVFVAHNARFDYGFLKSELKRYEQAFTSKHFCTVKLSRMLYPQFKHHNLDALIERFQLPIKNRHRALDDANTLWEFYKRVQQEFPQKVLLEAVETALKRPSRPLHISEDTLDSLPESPGVYIFHDAHNTPLYIGKSINIRSRVLSHFSADTSSTKERELSDQVHDIEAIVTSGELSALFLESKLIKEKQPLYNRKLRLSRSVWVLIRTTTSEGFDTVLMQEVENITIEDLPNIMAIVKSKKQAYSLLRELAREHSLCPKLLHLENAHSSCFSYQLGWCKGACVGKENPLTYNIRFLSAFSKHKIKQWPFDGPIIISEENPENNKQTSFIIDSWCYIGSCENGSCDINKQYVFDYDMYKILVQFLKKPKNLQKITLYKANTILKEESNY